MTIKNIFVPLTVPTASGSSLDTALLFARLLLMRWMAPLQRHRNGPISESDGTAASYILAFAERLLLAINGH